MRTHVLWLLVAELRKLIRPLVKLSYQRSEEHTSELQSRLHLVCRLLLEKKKKKSEIRLLLERQLHIIVICSCDLQFTAATRRRYSHPAGREHELARRMPRSSTSA